MIRSDAMSASRRLLWRVFCAAILSLCLGAAWPVFAQTYKNPYLVFTGSNPFEIAAADLNHDGKNDLIYIDGSSPQFLHVLLGNGDGTFTHGQDIQLPQGIGGTINVADVNNDGVPDLILGGGGPMAQIGVFLGNGDGTFGPIIISQFAPSGFGYADLGAKFGIADVNEDGAMDIIASDIGNDVIYILLGNNTGSFQLSTVIPHGTEPKNIDTADFNSDKHIDFIVHGDLSADVTVFLGNGDGTFQPGETYTGPSHLGDIVLADMDGDGHLDIVGTGQDGSIDILHGNPDGTFQNTSSGGIANAGPFPVLFAISDLNGDSILDLLTVSQDGLAILLGKGNEQFDPPQPYVSPADYPVVALADFNGDGHKDVAMSAPNGIAILFGNADGTFQSADAYDVGEGVMSLAAADFNQDHHTDIAVAVSTGAPQILLGDGTGKFSLRPGSTASVSGSLPAGVLTGDFDGDGKLDLVFTDSGSLQFLFGNGDGSFTSPVSGSFTINGNAHSTIGDFNRDGRADVFTPDYESYHVTLGQSNRSVIGSTVAFSSISQFYAGAVGDFNNDGKLDIVVASAGLQVLLGNGDGSFQVGRTLSTVIPESSQSSAGPIVVADFDGDGNADIAVPAAPSGFIILYGNGDGTFSAPVFYQLSNSYQIIQTADLDGDGKPDLVFANSTVVATVHNNGGRQFGAEQDYLAGNVGSVILADVNGDGHPDILVGNSPGTTVTVLLSQPPLAQTQGGVTISPEPSAYSQAFMLTANVSAVNSTNGTPTGSVRFSVDGQPVTGIVTLSGGTASFVYADVPPLDHGLHTIVAAYSGDSKFAANTFSTSHTIVSEVFQTSVQLTAQPSSTTTSQTVHMVATVTSPGPTPIPTGAVAFHDGANNMGTAQIDANGVAVFDTTLLGAGSHDLTAIFEGSVNFNGDITYASGTSAVVPVAVSATPTTTLLAAPQNPVTVGTNESLSATVTSSLGTPTGGVTFFDGSTPLATEPLDATGVAMCSVSFSTTGQHTITATYMANATFAASTSSALGLTVSTPASNPTVTSLSITVGATGLLLSGNVVARTGTPTGTVFFWDGVAAYGQAQLDGSGTAQFTGGPVSSGPHYLTAVYPGNSNFGQSVSSSQMVDTSKSTQDFTLDLSSTSASLAAGGSTSIVVSVNPVNGFNQQIGLSCSTGSADLSCAFVPSALTGGGIAKLNVTASGTRISAVSRFPVAPMRAIGTTIVAIFTSCLLLVFSRRRQRRVALAILSFAYCALLYGCGTTGSSGLASPGSYTFVITATGSHQGGAIVHSAQFQLTVTPGQ